MPSLFNRRSRSVSTSRPTPPSSSSAHVAAAQAFLANRQSQSNLSTSAAAAALRSMSPASVPVDQVQTKRTVNRQNSNSSAASASRGRPRGAVQRTPSNGSMSERTFRSPSPGRPATSQGFTSGAGHGAAPPMPPLPSAYADDVPPIPKKSHQRSASMETPSSGVLSPPHKAPKGRGQNVNKVTPASNAATTAARRSAGLPRAGELERTDSSESRNSINFSYPRGARPNSPPPRSSIATNGVSAAEALSIKNNLSKTAAQPVKKKKNIDRGATEGSHLQAGSVGGKATITPSKTGPDVETQQATDTTVKKKAKKAALTGQSTHFPDNEESTNTAASDSDVTPEKPKDKRAQRASGILLKQPSIVREDWEGEQQEGQISPDSPVSPSNTLTEVRQPKKAIAEANMSRKMEEPINSSKASNYDAVTVPSSRTQEPLRTLAAEYQNTRPTSISPSRSTRFSDRLSSDLASGRKHEPLPRSISPAKSALKHHSPSRSDASPTSGNFPHRRGSSITPSESSDVSVDGGSRRKKSARVSFEATNDDSVSADNETGNRSQKDAGRKGWFGLGKQKNSALDTIAAEDDMEEAMKPRPALPSFGSVRKNRQPENPSTSQPGGDTVGHSSPVTNSSSSSDVSTAGEPSTMNTSVSSDHAIGGMLFKDAQKKSNTPLLSQSASTGVVHHASESDSLDSDEDTEQSRSVSQSQPHQNHITRSAEVDVPTIAIQPATPGLEDAKSSREWTVDVPGGFPVSNTTSNRSSSEIDREQVTPTSDQKSSAVSGLGTGQSQLVSAATYSQVEPQALNTITEEDSDDHNSVYSDAAEDLSDLEGDGFGSINAIVESPVGPGAKRRFSSPPESPLAAIGQPRQDAARTTSWDDTQSHWSSLAQRFRDSNKAPKSADDTQSKAVQSSVQQSKNASKEHVLQPPPEIEAKPKKKQARIADTVPARLSSAQVPKALPKADDQSSYPTTPTTRSSTAKTQGAFRQSMRSEPASTVTLRERPKSMVTPPSQPKVALQKKHIPSAAPPKPVQRTFSNDSDSDSSFRKARRNRKPAGGQYTMKRSMRGGTSDVERPVPPTVRGGVRSMSPTNRRPLSPVGAQKMRMSMRGSQDLGTPTLRNQPERKRSSSLFSIGRKAKSPTRAPIAVPPMPKPQSRVVDSDDEMDAPRPKTFKSRFVDSSDEDEPEPMRPVRGIPRKTTDGDSTDLDDSSDDQGRKRRSAPKKLEIQIPPATQPIEAPPMSPNTAKKKGFWGRLRNKKDSEPEVNVGSTIAERNGTKSGIEAAKEKSKHSSQLGFESTAQRDALVEQTRLKLEAAKAQPASPRPMSPAGKLQRRSTPQRGFSDTWPLPPKIPFGEDDRPNTSDGVGNTTRPDIGGRQPTSETLRTNGGTAVYGKSGKKKKFPLLRRAFGLHD